MPGTSHVNFDSSGQQEIRTTKRDNFWKFCEDDYTTPVEAGPHKALAKGAVEIKLPIRQPDGTYTTSMEDRAKALLEVHSPGAVF